MGKAAIVNPYLDTLGGGERYSLSFAKALASSGWEVDLQWKSHGIIDSLEERFGIDLDGIKIQKDVRRGDGYDICFWLSDGSIPTLRARKNILHFQVPFHDVDGKNLMNKMKFFRMNKIICNSKFTKRIIDKEYGVDSAVIYPPVPVSDIKPKRKENLILSVGRFSQLKQDKRQDILIKAFKKMVNGGLVDWRFILAGGVEVGVDSFLDKLKKMSEGYPIEIIESPDFKILKECYGNAKIFWSASGYGIDEEKFPEKVEHFGITVVEAMAAGAIPVVFNAGGHKEIIRDGLNGYVWDTPYQLVAKTRGVISGRGVYNSLSREAKKDSQKFSYERFEKEVLALT